MSSVLPETAFLAPPPLLPPQAATPTARITNRSPAVAVLTARNVVPPHSNAGRRILFLGRDACNPLQSADRNDLWRERGARLARALVAEHRAVVPVAAERRRRHVAGREQPERTERKRQQARTPRAAREGHAVVGI